MKAHRPRLKAEHFYAQFHNQDADRNHSVNHPTKEWWDLYDDVPESKEKMSFARGGSVDKKAKRHPALSIPCVHIREEEYGIPTFTGKL